MKIFSKLVAFFSLFLIPLCLGAGTVSETLLEKLRNEGGHDAVLEFPSVMDQVLNNPFVNMFSGSLKTDMFTNLLQQFTSRAQAPFITALQQFGISEENITPFWISNKIALTNISLPFAQQFSSLPFLTSFKLREPYKVGLIPVTTSNTTIQATATPTVQWGVQRIEAPSVWHKTTGGGITIANIDTGVNGKHESLRSNYGGKFYNAITKKEYASATDDNGHGTHTMSIAVGTTKGIGVAPGSKWISCKALDAQGSGSDITLTRCAQWILKQKPKIVSNSWGGSVGGNSWFNEEIRAWSMAGIMSVFAIGNDGPSCKTARSPGDQQGNFLSVGATTESGTIASFSSRGPASDGKTKPEVSAPGQSIYAAWKDGTSSYKTISGSSMSTPMVAGAMALMLSANPSLTFTQIKSQLETTANHPSVSTKELQCGRPSNGGTYPNNAYGNGIINVKKAMGL